MTPMQAWQESGTGIMIMMRLPTGGEVVYVAGTQYGSANQNDLDGAIKFLQGLRDYAQDGGVRYDIHTGACDE